MSSLIIKRITAYSLITLVLIIFSRIYIHFSFGESSSSMSNMYLVVMVGGAIYIAFLLLTEHENQFELGFNLWNSGLACIVAGMLVRGVIELSGRDTTIDKYYYIAGIIFLALSTLTSLLHLIKITGKSRG